jgi:hypothetical protein
MLQGLDSKFEALDSIEVAEFWDTVDTVMDIAYEHAYKRPKMTTLLEEVAEAILASRGKHDDPLELELVQIASVAINCLWQLRMGYDIANLHTKRDENAP